VTNIPARDIASANVHLKVLRIAYTPDSDDVFNYYAWEHDRITLDPAEFQRGHISELNQAALEESYDVVAVSSVA
jgi:predicted solute-binding protein